MQGPKIFRDVIYRTEFEMLLRQHGYIPVTHKIDRTFFVYWMKAA